MEYDEWLACLALWREARGSSLPALAAIWAVIRNRVNDPAKRWPQTIPGVILQRKQFSSFNGNDPNSIKFPQPPAEGQALSPDWQAWSDCVAVVTAPIGADPTDGATGYESLPENAAKPPWADPDKITTTIGPFRFYRV